MIEPADRNPLRVAKREKSLSKRSREVGSAGIREPSERELKTITPADTHGTRL